MGGHGIAYDGHPYENSYAWFMTMSAPPRQCQRPQLQASDACRSATVTASSLLLLTPSLEKMCDKWVFTVSRRHEQLVRDLRVRRTFDHLSRYELLGRSERVPAERRTTAFATCTAYVRHRLVEVERLTFRERLGERILAEYVPGRVERGGQLRGASSQV